MMPNYARPPFSPLDPKPPRGSRVLEREIERARAKVLDRIEAKKAKQRDGRCRWPEKHTCRFALEAAHILDASLGGSPEAFNRVTFCGWIHRRGPESIHGKQLRVTVEDERIGAWGALAFWRQGADGEYYLVAREIAPFRYERD
jgi:hypothetical protein